MNYRKPSLIYTGPDMVGRGLAEAWYGGCNMVWNVPTLGGFSLQHNNNPEILQVSTTSWVIYRLSSQKRDGYLEFVGKDRKRGQSCHEYGSFCSRQARVKMILKTERKLGLGRHWDILQSDRSTCEKWTEWPLSESLVDEGIFNKVKGIKMQSLDFKRTILEPKSTSTSSIMFFTSQESKFKWPVCNYIPSKNPSSQLKYGK